MNTRILVADDAKFIRKAIKRILEQHDDFHVCAEANDGSEAVTMAQEECPDVAVLDIMMPNMNGIEAAKVISKTCPHTVMIANSFHARSEYFPELARSGVKGFVAKDQIVTDLIPAIEAVMAGGTWFKKDSLPKQSS